MYDPNFRWIDHHSCLRQSSLRVDHTQKPDSETDTPCSIPGSIPGRSVCRSGAFMRGKDLAARTCWEDHLNHGVPCGHGKSFANTWSKDYEDLMFQEKGSKGTKRRRSGGQAKSIGAV